MAGNKLGPKSRVIYTSDTGQIYNMRVDSDLATAGDLPLGNSGTPVPRRFRPRVVFLQDATGARKSLVVSTTSPLWDDIPGSVTIDGVTFTSTGRRGEKISF